MPSRYLYSMKVAILALVAFGPLALAATAVADPKSPAEGVYTSPTIVVYGRPNRPQVLVVIKTPTAAEAADSAHEALHAALWAQAQGGYRAPLAAP